MTGHDLPPAEMDVMQCLWQSGEMTARQVREMLEQRRPMSHSSVCTLLNRLHDKGIVSRKKGATGKAFVYEATIAATKNRRRVVGDVLDRVFQGCGVEMVASLLETNPPSEEEIDELQDLLDQLKSKRKGTQKSKKVNKRGRGQKEQS